MRRSFGSIPALALLLLASGAPAAEGRQVELKVGEQLVLDVPGVTKVSVSGGTAGRIVDVKPLSDGRLILFGRHPGRTNLPVFFRNRRIETWGIRVVDDAAWRFRAECAALLGTGDCAGLDVVAAGGKLVLRGRVTDLETYHRLRDIGRAYPDILLMVDVEPTVFDGLVRAINEQLGGAGLGHARVTRVGSTLLLEGAVSDDMEKRKVEAIVTALIDDALGTD